MPSPTFTIALQRQLARRRYRCHVYWQEALAQQREAKARELVVDALLKQAAYVYGLYGLRPPPCTRHQLLRQWKGQAELHASAVLTVWAKAGLEAMERREWRPMSEAQIEPCPPAVNASAQEEPVLIKRYANRRLYDTVRCQYVTREEVVDMARTSETVVVKDAKTGADVTTEVVRPA